MNNLPKGNYTGKKSYIQFEIAKMERLFGKPSERAGDDLHRCMLYGFCCMVAWDVAGNVTFPSGRTLSIDKGEFPTTLDELKIWGTNSELLKHFSRLVDDGLLKVESYKVGNEEGLIITVCDFDEMIKYYEE